MKKALVILAVVAYAAAADGQSVRLRTVAAVNDGIVRLADVADASGLAGEACQAEIVRLEPGSMKHVTLADVEQALRQAGVNVATINFSGAGRCEVRRLRPLAEAIVTTAATQPATEEPAASVTPTATQPAASVAAESTLGQRIISTLAEQLGVPADRVSVEFDASCRHTAEQHLDCQASIISNDRQMVGRRRWRIDATVGNRRYRYNLAGRATVRRDVVVAAKDLAAGQTINKTDVRLETQSDDGSMKGTPTLEQVIGQQVSRAVQAGRPVASDDLRAPVLVNRGQTVMVTSQIGLLSVTCRAKALGAGQAGQTVQMERADTQARLWAVVTGPGTARVTDGEAGL